MKNKTLFALFIITSASALLRLWNLDKPEGLWNDEYTSWYTASRNSFAECMQLAFKNCHMPLYYFFIKLWISIFPDTDISLRLSSVIPSLLTIIVLFFAGREFKDAKTGILCALFAGLSSFYIYFAQEARLYSLTALFTSLTVWMCIKTLKTGKRLHFGLFILSNAFLCMLHTLGIVFSFFIILFSLIYLYKHYNKWEMIIKNKRRIIQICFPILCTILLISPFLYSILSAKTLSQFWGGFSLSKILFVLSDYFTPVQCNITNSPDSFASYIYHDGRLNLRFIIFALIPLFIGLTAAVKAVFSKDKILNVLIYSSLCFFGVIFLFSAAGKMILITKYTSEIYPVLIIAFSAGMLSFKNKAARNGLIIIYFGISLLYLYFSPVSAPKLTRPEGNLAAVMLIEQSGLRKGDYIILTYYDYDKFERYMPDRTNYNIYSINKFDFNDKIFNNSSYYDVIKNGKTLYRNTFKEFPNKNIIKYADENFIKKMHKGDKIGILYLEGVSFLSNDTIQNITAEDALYNKTPFIFLVFSMLKNSLMYAFKDEYKMESITQAGNWTLAVYEKTK